MPQLLPPSPLTHLGDISVKTFLEDYWQKKPLLIRQAFPDFKSPLTPDELAGLALEEEVESRIVLEEGKSGPWELRSGPFEEAVFSELPESHWTLLIQAADHWIPEVQRLLDYFRFIPNWRLDDIMISYAADQGSVGPHFDYYDVFLLQGYGKRHWHVGQSCTADSPRLKGTALNILKEFFPENDWILEPGDMLYIPPQVAHHGIGIGDCMTYSIGFRAPSHTDILTEFSQDLASHLNNDLRYSDANLSEQSNPGEIGAAAIQQLKSILDSYTQDESKLKDWFGRYMTAPKYPDLEDADIERYDDTSWLLELENGASLFHHPTARFAFTESSFCGTDDVLLFVDGVSLPCCKPLALLLCREQQITRKQLSMFMQNQGALTLLTELLNQGSLFLDD